MTTANTAPPLAINSYQEPRPTRLLKITERFYGRVIYTSQADIDRANVSLAMSFVAALVPVLVCLAYIFALRQGKPPGYDRDIFEYLTTGRCFSPETRRSCTHPLL